MQLRATPENTHNWWSFTHLLKGLTKFRVNPGAWGSGSDDPDMPLGADRETADITEAHVVSSKMIHPAGCHKPLLDIDHMAWLIPSSKDDGNHWHLYVDLVCDEADYFDFLRAAAKIGLIERGYAEVSIERGHTDLRLPWVIKGEEKTAAEQGVVGVIPL